MCTCLGFRRATHYTRQSCKPEQIRLRADQVLCDQMQAIRKMHLSWGFGLIYAALRQEGHIVCKQRAYRLYRAMGMSLHRSPKKARIKRSYQALLAPERLNEGWAMDFLSEMIVQEGKSSVRIINIMDECSRKDLWVEAAKSIKAERVTEILTNLVELRGKPAYIRSDNGPEFISSTLSDWATKQGIELRFIQPGKPCQNGLIERLNGTRVFKLTLVLLHRGNQCVFTGVASQL